MMKMRLCVLHLIPPRCSQEDFAIRKGRRGRVYSHVRVWHGCTAEFPVKNARTTPRTPARTKAQSVPTPFKPAVIRDMNPSSLVTPLSRSTVYCNLQFLIFLCKNYFCHGKTRWKTFPALLKFAFSCSISEKKNYSEYSIIEIVN